MKYTLDYIKKNNLILLEAISGSHAYNTNIETSDTDYRGVYICELDDYLTGQYPQQINDSTNDIVFYELSRFLELVATNNPNILELLNVPERCIISKHPLFDLILAEKDKFITKSCKMSFAGYAIAQIKKARGLDKKQNWEKDRVTRKDVLDFCYVIDKGQSVPWKRWNNLMKYEEKFCGVTNISNCKDVYAVYYDAMAELIHSEVQQIPCRGLIKQVLKFFNKPMGFGYKGLVKVGEEDENGKINYGISNQLRLSSIPKGEKPVCTIFFNKDGYTEHCKDFLEYEEWLKKRNVHRYVDNKAHGQSYDSKNMMHCQRLISMAREIGEGKGIIVHRPDREYLLSIRKGEVDLEELINKGEEDIKKMDEIFDNSNLPTKVDQKLVNSLLVKIRREFYSI